MRKNKFNCCLFYKHEVRILFRQKTLYNYLASLLNLRARAKSRQLVLLKSFINQMTLPAWISCSRLHAGSVKFQPSALITARKFHFQIYSQHLLLLQHSFNNATAPSSNGYKMQLIYKVINKETVLVVANLNKFWSKIVITHRPSITQTTSFSLKHVYVSQPD